MKSGIAKRKRKLPLWHREVAVSEAIHQGFRTSRLYPYWLFLLAAGLPLLAGRWLGPFMAPVEWRIQTAQLRGQISPGSFPIRVVIMDAERGVSSDDTDPNKLLLSTLNQIASVHPTAIGIDRDFSPYGDSTGLSDEDALKVAQQAHELNSRGASIYLGVGRTAFASTADAWLGEKNVDLAACIELPDVGEPRQPQSIQVPGGQVLETMAYALAERHRNKNSLSGIRLDSAPQDAPAAWKAYTGKWFRVDYSCVEALEKEAIHVPANTKPRALPLSPKIANELSGKMVLIGFEAPELQDVALIDPDLGTSLAADHYVHSGVFMHAAAAYTLFANPLKELLEGTVARLGLETIVSAVGLVAAMWIWSRRRSGELPEFAENIARLLNAGTAVLLAYVLISQFRIVWPSFAVAVSVPLLEPYMTLLPEVGYAVFEPLWKKLRTRKRME